MDTWFSTLGYKTSPFSIKAVHEFEDLLGYEQEMQTVLEAVRNGSLVCIQGRYGNGKTTFVRRLIKHVGGSRKSLYFSANRLNGRLDVRRLLFAQTGGIQKLLKLTPRGLVCIIDEAHHLSKKDVTDLYDYYLQGYFSSIVFATSDKVRMNMPKKIQQALNNSTIVLKGVTFPLAEKIIRQRAGDKLPFLNDKVLKSLYDMSDGSFRKFLMLCDTTCRYAIENKKKRINPNELKKILSEFKFTGQ